MERDVDRRRGARGGEGPGPHFAFDAMCNRRIVAGRGGVETVPFGATVTATCTFALDFWSFVPESQHLRFTPGARFRTTVCTALASSPPPEPGPPAPLGPTLGPPGPSPSRPLRSAPVCVNDPPELPLDFDPPFIAILPDDAVVAGSADATADADAVGALSVLAGAVAVGGIWMTTFGGAVCCGLGMNTRIATAIPKQPANAIAAIAQIGVPFFGAAMIELGDDAVDTRFWGSGAIAGTTKWCCPVTTGGGIANGSAAMGAGGAIAGGGGASAGADIGGAGAGGAAEKTGTSSIRSAVARRPENGTTLFRPVAFGLDAAAAGASGRGAPVGGGGRGAIAPPVGAVGARGACGAWGAAAAGGGGVADVRSDIDVSDGRPESAASRTIRASSGMLLNRAPLFEPFLPAERVLRDGAAARLATELRHANGTDRDAVDRDVPLVRHAHVERVERARRSALARGLRGLRRFVVDGLRERAGERARLGSRHLLRLRARRGEVGREARALRRLRCGGRGAGGRGGGRHADAGLGDGGADLDLVAAFAALHAHRLAGDLVVGDLVLRLAVVAEELQPAPPSGLRVDKRSLRSLTGFNPHPRSGAACRGGARYARYGDSSGGPFQRHHG